MYLTKLQLRVFPASLLFALLFLGNKSYGQAESPDNLTKDQAYSLLISNPDAFRAYLDENQNYVVDLSKRDLSDLDLSRMRLEHANFSYAKLTGTNFKESNLSFASFIGATIIDANFNGSNVSYTNFNKTNATGATFVNATMKNTVLDYLMIQQGYSLDHAIINAQGIVEPATK